MPGLDRTGPEGKGSRTGRGLGKCNPPATTDGPDTVSGDQQHEWGSGRGFGNRFGRGGPKGRNRFRGGGRGSGKNRP